MIEDISHRGRVLFMITASIMPHKIYLNSSNYDSVNKIKVVSGGRKSYEPLLDKYLSPEVLDAVILGTGYSAPSPNEIHVFIQDLYLRYKTDIVIIIPNSLDEVLNFKLGAIKANFDGIPVKIIIVNEECWGQWEYTRHTYVGFTFVLKLAGRLKAISKGETKIFEHLRNLKMKTVSCHVKKSYLFIGTDLEYGTGTFVHDWQMSSLVSRILDCLFIEETSSETVTKPPVLLLNNFTYTTGLLNTSLREILKKLNLINKNVSRIYFGNFLFGPKGFSITLIRNISDTLIELADSLYQGNFWPSTCQINIERLNIHPIPIPSGPSLKNTNFLEIPIRFVCEALISSKEVFNKLDIYNDFGSSILPVLEIISENNSSKESNHERPYNVFNFISLTFHKFMPGGRGEVFSVLFFGIGRALSKYSIDVPVKKQMLLKGLVSGIDLMEETCIGEEVVFLTDVLSSFASNLEHFLGINHLSLNERLSFSINETNKILEKTYNMDSPFKKIGYPEVSAQACFVALTAMIEGVKAVANMIGLATNS